MAIAQQPPMTNEPLAISETLRLIQSEYLEIPGLHLTQRQVERLWQLDGLTARSLLRALIDAGFLRETRTGAFVRAGLDEEARYRSPAVRGVPWHPPREKDGFAATAAP